VGIRERRGYAVSAGKIKNLVLVALALINAFLLFVFATVQTGELSRRRERLEDIRVVLARGGIAVAPAAIGGDLKLAAQRTQRDESAEDQIVAAVLGAAEKTVRGGVLSMYTGDYGSASFNGRGEFIIESAARNPGLSAPRRESEIAETKRLLRDMGIRASGVRETREPGSGSVSVSVVCTYADAMIFNCPVKFEFESGRLARVSGRVASVAEQGGAVGQLDAATALLRFLPYILSEDPSCSEITRVTAGYQFNVEAVGGGELSPGYAVETDRGEFFIYSVTDTIERTGVTVTEKSGN
jgi:hypothetical protein